MTTDQTGYALTRDEGAPMWFLGAAPARIKATGDQTGGAYALFDFVVPPAGALPLHVHRDEDETVYVLEGAVTVFCGDERFAAKPGTFVFLPRGVPHGYRSDGDDPARVLEFTVPSGLEGLIAELSVPATDLAGPPPLDAQPALVEKLVPVAARYGLEIVGPLPT
jgi:quercetin dioxygenase-like cupin family protein